MQERERTEVKKQYGNKISVACAYLAAFIALVFVCSYLCYHSLTVFDETYMTGVVKSGSTSVDIELDVVLFRDDTLLDANEAVTGVVRPMAKNGEKVSVLGELLRVYTNSDLSPERSAEIIKEIDRLEAELALVDKALDIRHTTYYAAGKDLNNCYLDLIQSRDELVGGKGDISRVSDELFVLINKFNTIKDGDAELTEYRAEVLSKIEELAEEYSGEYLSVRADKSCYFFDASTVDGYEKSFRTDVLKSINADQLRQMLSAEPEAVSPSTVGKITYSYECYFASIASEEICKGLVIGNEYKLSFGDGTEVPVTLDRVASLIKNEGVLIFKCSVMPRGFLPERVSSVTVNVGERSGLTVPRSAVYETEQGSVVYSLEGGKLVMKRADIIHTDKGVCIISDGSGIDMETYEGIPYPEYNDVVIISGDGLYDGKVIG